MARPPQAPQPPELELSAEVCVFLSELEPEDVKMLAFGIKAMCSFIFVGSNLKWLIGALAGSFIAGIAVWQAVLFLLQQLSR